VTADGNTLPRVIDSGQRGALFGTLGRRVAASPLCGKSCPRHRFGKVTLMLTLRCPHTFQGGDVDGQLPSHKVRTLHPMIIYGHVDASVRSATASEAWCSKSNRIWISFDR
jgi:hypothetical protein